MMIYFILFYKYFIISVAIIRVSIESCCEWIFRAMEFSELPRSCIWKTCSNKKTTASRFALLQLQEVIFSIVMMAAVNCNYDFLMVDIGINGRISDGGVLSHTAFGKIPEHSRLPNTEKLLPFVFVGDDAFALKENFMKPYSQTELSNFLLSPKLRTSCLRKCLWNLSF